MTRGKNNSGIWVKRVYYEMEEKRSQPLLGNKQHLEGFPNITLDFIKIFNAARSF